MSRAGLWVVAAALAVAARGSAMSQAAGRRDTGAAVFYVAAGGNDAWSGGRAAANAARTDGPFATLERAVAAARQAHAAGRAVKIALRGGSYYLRAPLVLGPEDSGLLFAAYGRERPVVSGGAPITGWKRAEGGRWTAHLPAVQRGEWSFSQLWVNGQRRYRPRLPKNGYHFIADALPPSGKAKDQGFDRFRFEPGQIRSDWHNLSDVEVMVAHIWTMSRFRIASVDDAARAVTFTGNTQGTSWWASMPKGNRYLVENVREALSEPGEWYLDRTTGDLTYLPMPGEDMTKAVVIAPRLERVLEVRGTADTPVDNLRFEGITFAHTNWNSAPGGNSFAQAEVNLGAAVSAEFARNCAFEGCAVRHVGTYAVELGQGCKSDTLRDCELTDMGAGGVKIGTMGIPDDQRLVADHVSVVDCLIAHGGRLHPAAVGVWIGQSPYNTVQRNDIHDFYYTGISMGWTWGYGNAIAHHNVLADNHIYDLGQGVLSDMGGIYTLGATDGTVLRHNRIHDVWSYDYGGWGIYFDEGTTHITAEDNLAYRCKSAGFHQHYGKENRVTNNVFALNHDSQLMRTRAEEHLSFTFDHNIVYWTRGALLASNWSGDNYKLDWNVYWDAAGQPVSFAGMSFEDWQKKGQDAHSLVADPLFVDPARGDFRLRPGSPAVGLGFRPIAATGFGRSHPGPNDRKPEARAFPAPPPPQPISEDFEAVPVGEKTPGATTSEETDAATARVTDETAAGGTHSLKFVDAAGQQSNWNPHVYYTPAFTEGVATGSFDLRWEKGAVFFHEWRDSASPYHAGPSLRVEADGTLVASGRRLLQMPAGQWVHFDIVCPLGERSKGTYDLVVRLPGRVPPSRYNSLPCSREMREIRWFGFTADGAAPGVFYLDNIRLAVGPVP